MYLAEMLKIVPVLNDGDLAAGADLYTDCINMKNFHRATFIVNFQTIAGGNHTIFAYSGAADATYTSQLAFSYAYGGAAQGSANCDVLAAEATVVAATGLVVDHTLKDNFMLIIEVNASIMDVANQEEWLALDFNDSSGAATGNVCVVAILEPRYSQNRSASALT